MILMGVSTAPMSKYYNDFLEDIFIDHCFSQILWEKRHYLYHLPQALTKVLLAAHSWAYAQLPDLHGMLHNWTRLKPIQALELLLPV